MPLRPYLLIIVLFSFFVLKIDVSVANDEDEILTLMNHRIKSIGWGSWKPEEIPEGVLSSDAKCPQSASGSYKQALYISRISTKVINDRTKAHLVYSYMCGGNGVGVDLVINENGHFKIVDNFKMADMYFVGDFDRVENQKIYFIGDKWTDNDAHCCPSLRAQLSYDISSGQQSLKILNQAPKITTSKSGVQNNDPPFRCIFDVSVVACDVRIDEANISEVLLNRGNCASPLPTAQDEEIYQQFARELPKKDPVIMSAKDYIKNLAIIGYATRLFAPEPERSRAESIARAALNPVGRFVFGETLQILNTCSNLAEVTFVFNGMSSSTQDGINWR